MFSVTISVRARAFAMFGALLALAALVPSSRAQESPGGRVIIPADAIYSHRQSGMVFPPDVGDFRRTSIYRYDEAGTDESVGYSVVGAEGGIVATVYIYPAPAGVVATAQAEATEREFRLRQDEILYVHPDAKLMQTADLVLTQGATTYHGRKAVYQFEHVFAGKLQPLQSELHLFGFVGGKWFVKYRFSYPVALRASAQVEGFMRSLRIAIRNAP